MFASHAVRRASRAVFCTRTFSSIKRDSPLSEDALKQLFLEARTHYSFTSRPIAKETLVKLHDLVKMAPTGTNCSPARFIFVQSEEAKNRLMPLAMEGNRDKIKSAAATVVIGLDEEFEKHLPFLFPFNPEVPSWYAPPAVHEATLTTNGLLQAGYLIIAARSLGLDVGPMAGFDPQAVAKEFFPGQKVRAALLVNLGYGDKPEAFPRAPRFEFNQQCQIL